MTNIFCTLKGCFLFEKRFTFSKKLTVFRDVAQSGSVPRSGRGGRRFKSCHPDNSLHF